MHLKSLSIVVLALLSLSFVAHKDLSKKVDKEIKSTFELEAYSYKPVHISDEIAKDLPAIFTGDNFFELSSEQTVFGFAYMGSAASKTDTFEYLVLLDKELIVKKAKVLVYREDYGGEIGSKRWLKQFIGKTQDDTLRYGDNIIAISGATISVRSMTAAINNFLLSIKTLHSKAIL